MANLYLDAVIADETAKVQVQLADILKASRAQSQQKGLTMSSPMIEYKSGMKRSSRKPRFDLIDSDWLRGVAEVMTEGCDKYGANNWRKGDRDAAIDAVNHLQDHLLLLKDGDVTEQHIFNLSCNAMFISYYMRQYPDLFQDAKVRQAVADIPKTS
jgi:hypothetical protein